VNIIGHMFFGLWDLRSWPILSVGKRRGRNEAGLRLGK
jgi:hypothetical protein